MKKRKILLIIFVVLAITGAYLAYRILGPAIKQTEDGFFYVHTGDSYEIVKEELLKQNVLSSTGWFDRISAALNYKESVKPGKYKVDNGMSVLGLVRMLRAGSQTSVKLVLVKLRTKEELAGKLGKYFEADSISIINFLNNKDTLSRYNLDTNVVMTAIIPNTYSYNWNMTSSKLFTKLYFEREKFWTSKRKDAAKALGFTPEQIYSLASIVEEETNKQDDKGKIASVYINRMRTGMKLAADPTVKFAMRDFGLKRIYHKHLEYPSAWNTYQHTGLPPGPICTPSIKTLDAVLNAPTTTYLFFVARADFSGYHDFAVTYEEHLRYAKAYQQALDREMEKRKSAGN